MSETNLFEHIAVGALVIVNFANGPTPESYPITRLTHTQFTAGGMLFDRSNGHESRSERSTGCSAKLHPATIAQQETKTHHAHIL